MAKYLIDSTDIEIEEVSGTENLKFNLKSGNSAEVFAQNLMNYSETETEIGEWLGKSLYRKVVNFGNLPNNTTGYVDHNILNIDNIIRVYGYIKGALTYIPLPQNKITSSNDLISLWATKQSIYINTTSDRSSYTGYIIIEYTKTN